MKDYYSADSIAKMGRCENVTTDVLLGICEALDCDVENIMECVSNSR
ncbi:MAG TPA: helix-turn-helix domain-containing protein [Lachnospiraceae bacterium]|nr:helix-turn-helix domain-containing protein [Lachnospiraceae bacterium]